MLEIRKVGREETDFSDRGHFGYSPLMLHALTLPNVNDDRLRIVCLPNSRRLRTLINTAVLRLILAQAVS